MKIGVLGLGSIGMRHARNFLALGHDVQGYDPDSSKCAAFSYERSTQARESVINRSDALVIAGPSHTHLHDLMCALKMEIPALVEKPICTKMPTSWERSLIENGRVWVGNNLRFHPSVKHAKWMMDHIGKPYRASFEVSQKTTKEPYLEDGVLLNMGSHEIDLATYLLGKAELVFRHSSDSSADMILRHESACTTTIHMDFIGIPEIRKFNVYGLDNQVEINFKSNPHIQWNAVYLDEAQAFIDEIKGKKTPLATGREGLSVLDLIVE